MRDEKISAIIEKERTRQLNNIELIASENYVSKDVLEGMYKMEKYFPEYGSEIYVACVNSEL